MPRDPISATLTPQDTQRALSIAFAGSRSGPPVLLATTYAEGGHRADPARVVLRQDVVDLRFEELAMRLGWTWSDLFSRYDADARSLRAGVADLAARARAEDRLVVGWSRRELEVIVASGAGRTATSELVARYRAAKATARRWRQVVHPDTVLTTATASATSSRAGHPRLDSYLELAGFEVPAAYGPGRTGDNLTRLERARQGRRYPQLTPRQAQAWVELTGHNLHACLGLQHLAERAARELAEATAAA